MRYIRIFQWIIRIILIASIIAIVIVVLYPNLNAGQRFVGIGLSLQVGGISLAFPELAQRLSDKQATDLIIWAETFFPLWKTLSKIHLAKTLRQLAIVLSIVGVVLIIVGLVLQYLAVYYT